VRFNEHTRSIGQTNSQPKGKPMQTANIQPLLPDNMDVFYGGAWHKGAGSLIVHSPSDGRHLAKVATADSQQLDAAVAAAKAAQREWRLTKPLERTRAMQAASQIVRENAADLAALDALDSGNPLKGMLFDVELGATLMEFFAGLATELKGHTVPMGGRGVDYVQRVPLGVVARIVPFNHPLMFACAKIAAPIIAGNAVILKPSEHTPLSALRLADLIGGLFPAGLLSVLNGGPDLGAAIASHPGIANVSVVGSVATGRAVMRGGADTLKRLTLELGGKNALVIFPDADPEAAIAGAIKGMNLGWTAGQSCGSTSRVFVHNSLHDIVVAGLKVAFDKIELGDPIHPDTEMGCLSTKPQFDKTRAMIRAALDDGARMVSGGQPVPEALGKGFFVRPTLFADVSPDMRIARDEVFGPVLSVLRWSDYAPMIEAVNALDVGLTASIWTRDLNTALRAVDDIEAGYVWVNNASDHILGAPFGGMKQSGIGREECLEELLTYTEQKNVSIALS
jgi:betaine-aldehyde dehydrogenase